MGQTLSSKSKARRNLFPNTKLLVNTNEESKENINIIWFDPNIESHEDTENTKEQLQVISDYIIFMTNFDDCVQYIQSTDKEKFFLITSGVQALEIVPQISSISQIDSIFIYCMKKERYESSLNAYRNVIGIYVNLDDLVQSIQAQIDHLQRQMQTFSFFDHHQKSTKELSKDSAAFVWFQLFNYVIARLPHKQKAKQEMIRVCRDYYRGNEKELKLIDEFEQNYRSRDALRYYSKDSFIYRLINKALRTEDIDLLYVFRFFIGDLSRSLEKEHKKLLSSKIEILDVYRGLKLDKEEYETLKQNHGKLISTNGYLSTSLNESQAKAFAKKPTKRTDIVPVLFHIQCNIKEIDKSIAFADISGFSPYPDEKEVLFDLNACFLIESIDETDESLIIINMKLSNEGHRITKDYLELTRQATEEFSVPIVFGRLLCNLGEYDNSQKYFEQLLLESPYEDRAWIEFHIGRAYYFKGEWDEAREYYDRAYYRMMKSRPPRLKDSAWVLNNLANVFYNQGNYNDALDHYKRALAIRERYYLPNHVSIVDTISSIGRTLKKQEKYDEAIEYYQRALQIKEKFYSFDYVDIASTLNSLSEILREQGKNDEALNYDQRVLAMRNQLDVPSYISACYENQKERIQALNSSRHSFSHGERRPSFSYLLGSGQSTPMNSRQSSKERLPTSKHMAKDERSSTL